MKVRSDKLCSAQRTLNPNCSYCKPPCKGVWPRPGVCKSFVAAKGLAVSSALCQGRLALYYSPCHNHLLRGAVWNAKTLVRLKEMVSASRAGVETSVKRHSSAALHGLEPDPGTHAAEKRCRLLPVHSFQLCDRLQQSVDSTMHSMTSSWPASKSAHPVPWHLRRNNLMGSF